MSPRSTAAAGGPRLPAREAARGWVHAPLIKRDLRCVRSCCPGHCTRSQATVSVGSAGPTGGDRHASREPASSAVQEGALSHCRERPGRVAAVVTAVAQSCICQKTKGVRITRGERALRAQERHASDLRRSLHGLRRTTPAASAVTLGSCPRRACPRHTPSSCCSRTSRWPRSLAPAALSATRPAQGSRSVPPPSILVLLTATGRTLRVAVLRKTRAAAESRRRKEDGQAGGTGKARPKRRGRALVRRRRGRRLGRSRRRCLTQIARNVRRKAGRARCAAAGGNRFARRAQAPANVAPEQTSRRPRIRSLDQILVHCVRVADCLRDRPPTTHKGRTRDRGGLGRSRRRRLSWRVDGWCTLWRAMGVHCGIFEARNVSDG